MTAEVVYNLTFLTPCFCAGADQSVAEIRPSAIRGQLRWWFRALGGTQIEEREIFGGIAKDKKDIRSSALIIRVSEIMRGSERELPKVNPNAASSYVWYFASVSGKPKEAKNKAPGPRWDLKALMPAGTSFKLHVLRRCQFESSLFDQSLLAFLMLGSIGLRATRGLGAFTCKEAPFSEDILNKSGFRLEIRDNISDWAHEVGSLVKGTRSALGFKSAHPSPFGSSTPRQTSGVWFRPLAGNRLAIFQPPDDRVLGPESRYGSPVIGFTKA